MTTSKNVAENFEYTVGRFDYNKGIAEGGDTYFEIIDAYRLVWREVPYEPGEIKAVVYQNGEKIGETTVKTSGDPANLLLEADRTTLKADGMDLCYVTISMVDDQGNLCPWAMDKINLKVEGAATFMGIANGDSMGHDVFTDESHTLFYGKAVAVMRNIPGQTGEAKLIVTTQDGESYERAVTFQE